MDAFYLDMPSIPVFFAFWLRWFNIVPKAPAKPPVPFDQRAICKGERIRL